MPPSGFPDGFLWGASSASIQVEGGAPRSSFEAWSRRKGWTPPGEGCRSWELFERDVAALKALKANAYRFSLEWSRVAPEPGVWDEDAFARYLSWIRLLKREGIAPMVCLHHWSEPQWLLDRWPGGWLEDGPMTAFLDYVRAAADRLAGECSEWLVFNEPMNYAVAAYGAGHFPPGRRLLWNADGDFNKVLVPRLCDAHNEAARILKKKNPAARIGVAMNTADVKPASASRRDEEAAERWDWFMHRQFVDRIVNSLDYVGVNYYTSIYVKKAPLPWGFPMGVLPGYAEFERGFGPLFKLFGGRPQDEPRTMMGWTVDPDGLRRVVLRTWKRWGKPVMITENGLADTPGVSRAAFVRDHAAALRRAIDEGANVLGYLHWSLLDNWEWGSYEPKFGLYTRERVPKDGADAFAELAP